MYSSKSSFNFVSISVAVISIHRITVPADNSILFIAVIIPFLVFYSSNLTQEPTTWLLLLNYLLKLAFFSLPTSKKF